MKKFMLLGLLLSALIPASNIMATPVPILKASLTRTVRGTNTIGWSSGDRALVSAVLHTNIFNASGGKKATTVLGMEPSGVYNELFYNDYFGEPNYSRTFAYSSNILDPWLLSTRNGSDVISKNTNTLAGVDTVPFVRNVQLKGAGLEPTVSWTTSGDVSDKRVQVYLHDADGTRFWKSGTSSVPASNTSVKIPPGELEDGKKYTVRIKVFTPRDDGMPLSQTETFIDFTPLKGGDPSTVFMPVVGNDVNADDDLGNPFYFDVDVTAKTPIFIDPFIAIGYEYQIGSGDPLFESVTLPFLGDDNYQLWLYDGSTWAYDIDISAGSQYFFNSGNGIDLFRILGIEESLGLDPADVTAFITQLTFTADGTFKGSMTPITKEVDPVPEPATMLLFGTGLLGLAGITIRRRKK